MPDYSKAKIYRIFCEDDEYIGSTTRPLSERMNGHRQDYKRTIIRCCSSCILFDKYGIKNCKIELIEDYPCERKEQLLKREGEIQRERNCVNKLIAGRTPKEWREEHKEMLNIKKKEYTEKNKEKIYAYNKQYYLKKKLEQECDDNTQNDFVSDTQLDSNNT